MRPDWWRGSVPLWCHSNSDLTFPLPQKFATMATLKTLSTSPRGVRTVPSPRATLTRAAFQFGFTPERMGRSRSAPLRARQGVANLTRAALKPARNDFATVSVAKPTFPRGAVGWLLGLPPMWWQTLQSLLPWSPLFDFPPLKGTVCRPWKGRSSSRRRRGGAMKGRSAPGLQRVSTPSDPRCSRTLGGSLPQKFATMATLKTLSTFPRGVRTVPSPRGTLTRAGRLSKRI
jgi:hypothetical protein